MFFGAAFPLQMIPSASLDHPVFCRLEVAEMDKLGVRLTLISFREFQ